MLVVWIIQLASKQHNVLSSLLTQSQLGEKETKKKHFFYQSIDYKKE